MPIGFRATGLMEKIAELRRRAEQAGRDPNQISMTICGMQPERALIDEYRSAGVERAIFMVPPAERDEVLPLLDKYAELIS
jgi:hypothetical protein